MYPEFRSEIFHYAVGCPDGDTMTLTLSTEETDTRLAVNGIQRANQNVVGQINGTARRERYSDHPHRQRRREHDLRPSLPR